MTESFTRYAVYFAPRTACALGRFGPRWLGWDAEAGVEVAGPEPDGLPRARDDLVATPRKYGFHGTLKAPFRLAADADVAALDEAVRAVALRHAPFEFPLMLSELGPFLALVPDRDVPALDTVAADCVRDLDGFRAPPTPDEIARRNPARLSAREVDHLAAWGYPYVFDRFQFHLTLTGALPRGDQIATRTALERVLAPVLAEPVGFEDICLFGEAADGRFRIVRRYPLGPRA